MEDIKWTKKINWERMQTSYVFKDQISNFHKLLDVPNLMIDYYNLPFFFLFYLFILFYIFPQSVYI